MTDHVLDFEQSPLPGESGLRYTVTRAGAPMSFAEVLAALRDDPGLCAQLSAQLAACTYEAFFFETPPLRATTLDRPFEFVLIDAPALGARAANPRPFAAHLADAELVATFSSLSGDATLVAPTARGADCAHLGAFTRTASSAQRWALWAATAEATLAALTQTPRWLSTSGLGVAWLHMRIDQRPKYYSHRPYRAP